MKTKTRFSVALDEQDYTELLEMANKHQISMAWIVRQAVTDFLGRYRSETAQLPLQLPSAPAERSNA